MGFFCFFRLDLSLIKENLLFDFGEKLVAYGDGQDIDFIRIFFQLGFQNLGMLIFQASNDCFVVDFC